MKRSDFILVIGSITFTLLLAEVALRVVKRKPLFENFVMAAAEARVDRIAAGSPEKFDKFLGWVPKENTVAPSNWGAEVRLLEDGLRSNGPASNTTPLPPKAILAVGDSFVFGDQVRDQETWPAILERLLKTPVGNGGVSGYGLDQITLRAEQLAAKYRPRLLIVNFIPADISRNKFSELWGLHKPYFEIKNGNLELQNSPVPLPNREQKPTWLHLTFGYSYLAHLILSRIAPDFWVNSISYRQNIVHENDLEVACLLMARLARLKKNGTVSEILVTAQSQGVETVDTPTSTAHTLQCAAEQGLRTVDFHIPLKTLRATDPEKFKSLWDWHMTAAGNAFIAENLRDALVQLALW